MRYTRVASDGSRTIPVTYVDKMVIVDRNELELRIVAAQIEEDVVLRVKPTVTELPGMCVDCDEVKGIINISNAPLIDGSLRRFVLKDAN